ncbi:Y-box-binding protein 2 [Sparganum proliferum]
MTAEVAPPNEEKDEVRQRKSFELLNVIVEKVTGTVKWFSITRRYGFIQRDDNQEDVFVHRTAITASKQRFPSLKTGEPVEFSVVQTTGGINAASVTGPGGKPVKGTRRYFRRATGKPGPTQDAAPGPSEHDGDQPVQANGTHPGGDVEGPRHGGFRGRRRGSGRRPPRTSHDGMGDYANGSDAQNGGGVSPTGGAPRPRPRPRRGRGRIGMGGYEHSAPRQQHSEGEANGPVNQDQHPPRRGRRPFRRGRPMNGNRSSKPTSGDDGAGATSSGEHEQQAYEGKPSDELSIGDQLANMKIEEGDSKDPAKSKNPVAETHEETPAEQAKPCAEKEAGVEDKGEEPSESTAAETMEADEKDKKDEQPAN